VLRNACAQWKRRGARRSTVAFGTVRDDLAGVRIAHLEAAFARHLFAGYPERFGTDGGDGRVHRLLGVIQCKFESVEVSPAAQRIEAFGIRRLRMSGTRCSEIPPWDRSGNSSCDRSCRDLLVPSTTLRSDTIDDVADPVGRQLEALPRPRCAAARPRFRAARAAGDHASATAAR
jgi:hypothetical protein